MHSRVEASRLALGRIYGLRLLIDIRIQAVLVTAVLAMVVFARLGQVVYSANAWLIGYDFSAYWLAGKHLLEGNALYTPEQLAGPYASQQQFLYLYPPFLAVLIAPLSAVFPTNFQAAAWVWAGLGVIVLTVSVVAVLRVEGLSGRRRLLIVLSLALALPPVALELLMGNVHLVLLGLLALVWLGVRRPGPTGDFVAGLAVAAASLIKVFPVLLLLWFVLTGRYRAAAIAVVAMAVLVIATLPLTGEQAWLAYPVILANLSPPTDPSNVLAPTIWLAELLGFEAARVAVTAAGLVVMVWSARSQPAGLSFAVTVAVSLVIVPALYLHYLALAVLPLLLAYSYLRVHAGLAAAYVVLFVGTQLSLWQPESTAGRGLATVSLLFVVAVLLLARKGSSSGAVEAGGGAITPSEPPAAGSAAPS